MGLACLVIAVSSDLLRQGGAVRFPVSASVLAGVLVTPFLAWAGIVVFARLQVLAEDRHDREAVRAVLSALVGARHTELRRSITQNTLLRTVMVNELTSLLAAASKAVDESGTFSWPSSHSVTDQLTAMLRAEPQGLEATVQQLESLEQDLRRLFVYSDRLQRQSIAGAIAADHRARDLVGVVLRSGLVVGLDVLHQPGSTWDGQKILREDGTHIFEVHEAAVAIRSIVPARVALLALLDRLDEVLGPTGSPRWMRMTGPDGLEPHRSGSPDSDLVTEGAIRAAIEHAASTERRRSAAAVTERQRDLGLSSAVQECDQAVDWYARNAWRCRIRHQVLEVVLLTVGASISVVALAVPAAGVPTAVLGAVVVLLGGLRQVFHWHENYVRFTQACQKLKAERRRYAVGQPPYDDPVQRDKKLVERLNRVEYEETMGWSELMQDRSPSSAQPK